ncbi:MAG: chorismate synthase [Ignavibacteria bacterium]|nr:chorismate synthase [Ignavibacteria bacterium]MBT8382127.1 chorismate synthase [Ignavibacteria bacterium]MBT8392585.1 chorismate synthase [Ignavibacteria bacterium]
MIRFLTSGESHGKALSVIIDGFPSNLSISKNYINSHLKRRQMGYGRSVRMKIENDTVQILSGIRFGKTIGSPISLLIENKDWINWQELIDSEKKPENLNKITIPRPGHADLVGTLKYNFDDIRNSIERSSARETAARVAAGTLARKLLEEFGISIGSYVESIGGVYSNKSSLKDFSKNRAFAKKTGWQISQSADTSSVRVLDSNQEKNIISKIKTAKKKGDTLGGTFLTFVTGVPIGLGSFMQFDRKIDADIAFHLMSINAIKGVEIGDALLGAEKFGSQTSDEIKFKNEILSRSTNYAGGIEGGVTNGQPIVVRAAMKPISTLAKPLKSIDLKNMKSISSRYERSDITAVPACSVIAESMMAWVIAKHFLVKFGGDSMEELRDNFNSYTKKLHKRIKQNFRK